MLRSFLMLAAFFGFTGVALGAFAASGDFGFGPIGFGGIGFRASRTARAPRRRAVCIGIDDYIDHLKEINKFLPLLPMIKDLEGVPKEIEHADKSFMEPAMCDIIPG